MTSSCIQKCSASAPEEVTSLCNFSIKTVHGVCIVVSAGEISPDANKFMDLYKYGAFQDQGPLLLTWINFNASMDM